MREARANEKIRAHEVRLIDSDGAQLGIVPIKEALRISVERGLDLVEVASGAVPPVCRIMDYGKYKYQISKKQAAKKAMDVKEVKIRPHIDIHDLERKVKNIREFLDEGHKAKITMIFRGREKVRPELGMKVFEKLTELMAGNYTMQQSPKHEGNSITMVLAPKGGK